MSTLLGKRKRRTHVERTSTGSRMRGEEQFENVLRKHFESKFKPLQIKNASPTIISAPDEDCESANDSESWSGISNDGDPEIVDHTQHDTNIIEDSWQAKQDRRSFMSDRPPSTTRSSPRSLNSKDGEAGEKAIEAANMKNDYALQRLLKESSLLKSSRTDARGTMPSAVHPSDEALGSSLSLHGAERHKALDLRLQSLGAKDSLFKQTKMPLNHRFGIIEKRRSQEKARRREARENGIVLERAINGKKPKVKTDRRDRGVGGPSIGRMKGGTLKLSPKDIRDIQGNDNRGKRSQKTRRRR